MGFRLGYFDQFRCFAEIGICSGIDHQTSGLAPPHYRAGVEDIRWMGLYWQGFSGQG